MKTLKRKLTTLIATAMVAAMMIGTSMTACAAPRTDLYGPVTAVTPGGVNIYGYAFIDALNTIGPVPAVYLTAIDAAGITNEMSDMEKCVRVNNYLCAVINNSNNSSFFTEEWAFRNPYSAGEYALTTGNGVCTNYASAFEMMVTSLGIECRHMRSGTMDHAWNEVVIDGVTYYNDAYWNDCHGNGIAGAADPYSGMDYLMSPVLWANHAYPDIQESGTEITQVQ